MTESVDLSHSASSDPHLTPAAEAALASLREGIGARLRGVCADMPPAEFDALVARIARFTHRWSSDEVLAREAAIAKVQRAD